MIRHMALGGHTVTTRNLAPLIVAAVTLAATSTGARAEGVDYIKDAKLYYRVVACKGQDPIPATLDAKAVEKHCDEQTKRYEKITKTYFTPAAEFFAALRPAGLPTSVVYPFGGGDLMSALV